MLDAVGARLCLLEGVGGTVGYAIYAALYCWKQLRTHLLLEVLEILEAMYCMLLGILEAT